MRWQVVTVVAACIVAGAGTQACAQAPYRDFGRFTPPAGNQNLLPPRQSPWQYQNGRWQFQPGQLPGTIQQPVRPALPVVIQPAFPIRDSDLDDFIENAVERNLPQCVDNVSVNINRGLIEVQVDAHDYACFCQVRNFILALPQLAGRRVLVVCDNLDDMIERRLRLLLGRAADNVNVNVDHDRRRIEIEVELRHPAFRANLQQALASLPELSGYNVRLEVEIDD